MRVRITAFVALLVALALAGAGLIVWAIQDQRIEQRMLAEVDQELAEFRQLQGDGLDPATGEPFEGAPQMIRLFLERNVPDQDELLVGWWDGGPQIRLPADDLAGEQVFRAAVTPLIGTGGSTRLDHPTDGELLVTVQPVRSPTTSGALVLTTYVDETRAGLYATMRTYTIVSALSLIVITALAAWQSGRLLAPLRTLRETTEEISATDLSRRLPVSGNDDITALTRTLNAMLARLDAAFAGQRQFLDDAGHELRTPLTVLRGHLELLDPADPEEVRATRTLLLDETDRMSRLVGDLILLAKSDRPDFLTLRRVTVAELVDAIFRKATALGDREWRLGALPADDVVVAVDEQRVTQAVLQLCDNAVKHTTSGAPIELAAAVAAGDVEIAVTDRGRGVPEADRERVFERFGRSAVPEGDEGFGLGLSIVRAIAEAHGGTARVEDAEPGARFVVRLPGGGV